MYIYIFIYIYQGLGLRSQGSHPFLENFPEPLTSEPLPQSSKLDVHRKLKDSQLDVHRKLQDSQLELRDSRLDVHRKFQVSQVDVHRKLQASEQLTPFWRTSRSLCPGLGFRV